MKFEHQIDSYGIVRTTYRITATSENRADRNDPVDEQIEQNEMIIKRLIYRDVDAELMKLLEWVNFESDIACDDHDNLTAKIQGILDGVRK